MMKNSVEKKRKEGSKSPKITRPTEIEARERDGETGDVD